MKFSRVVSLAALAGIDFRRGIANLRGLKVFLNNKRLLTEQIASSVEHTQDFPITRLHPMLTDRRSQSGVTRGGKAYFYQDLHVAQLIHKNNPASHVDVGSRVDGFVAHVAAFRSIEVMDIRPSDVSIENISVKQLDLLQDHSVKEHSVESLSCLHVLEHFGLGRYGDEVDYFGYQKGWDNLFRMLKPGGKLYFSVPIGPQRIEFDAHRIFSMPFLLEMINPRYRIDSFAYVNDSGSFFPNADPTSAEASSNFGCKHGCGIFELTKLPHSGLHV